MHDGASGTVAGQTMPAGAVWTRDDQRRFALGTSAYVVGSLGLLLVGFVWSLRFVTMVGFLLLAGTFVPLPFDLYVMAIAPYYEVGVLVTVAAVLNTVAVVAERWFLLHLFRSGRGRRVVGAVRGARVSAWFRRAPFWTVVVAGFSFIPFEPVRFFAVANGHALGSYAAATLLGRGARLLLLVLVGNVLAGLQWLTVALWVGFVLYMVSLTNLRRMLPLFQRDSAQPAPGVEDDKDADDERR